MGGSGGVFSGSNRSPEKVAEKLKSDALVSASKFESTLAKTLNTLLVNYNSRDTDSVKEKLVDIKQALGVAFDCSVDTLFGGSVAKKTYIDGLSDVDSLLVFPDDRDMLPHNLLKKIEKILNSKLGKGVEVSTGNLAVTITYKNGPDIQIIPAIQKGKHIQIPNFEADTWSKIDPVSVFFRRTSFALSIPRVRTFCFIKVCGPSSGKNFLRKTTSLYVLTPTNVSFLRCLFWLSKTSMS